MLSTAELTAMRATAETALPDSCVIQSQSLVSDGAGAGTLTWTTAGTVDCRLAPPGGTGAGESVQGDRVVPDGEAILTLPHGTAIDTDSRIIHGGGTFHVEAIHDRSWEITMRVEARKQS